MCLDYPPHSPTDDASVGFVGRFHDHFATDDCQHTFLESGKLFRWAWGRRDVAHAWNRGRREVGPNRELQEDPGRLKGGEISRALMETLFQKSVEDWSVPFMTSSVMIFHPLQRGTSSSCRYEGPRCLMVVVGTGAML